MNAQVNLRLPKTMLTKAQSYAKNNGYSTVQEFIKETLREKLFGEEELTPRELELVNKVIKISDSRNLYGTEEEMFKKLRSKK